MLLCWWVEGRIFSLDWPGWLLYFVGIFQSRILYRLTLELSRLLSHWFLFLNFTSMKKLGRQQFQVFSWLCKNQNLTCSLFISSSPFWFFLNIHLSALFIAMPELLSSAKSAVVKGQSQGRDETYVKQLSDYIIPNLVEALHKVKVLPIYYGVYSANFLALYQYIFLLSSRSQK